MMSCVFLIFVAFSIEIAFLQSGGYAARYKSDDVSDDVVVAKMKRVLEKLNLLEEKFKRSSSKNCMPTDLHCRLGMPRVCTINPENMRVIKSDRTTREKTRENNNKNNHNVIQERRKRTTYGLEPDPNEICAQYGDYADLFFTTDDTVIVCE